jgi:hypothetical protein
MSPTPAEEYWGLCYQLDLATDARVVLGVQAWAGVAAGLTDHTPPQPLFIPRRQLGVMHLGSENDATRRAEQDGTASGLPRWTKDLVP